MTGSGTALSAREAELPHRATAVRVLVRDMLHRAGVGAERCSGPGRRPHGRPRHQPGHGPRQGTGRRGDRSRRPHIAAHAAGTRAGIGLLAPALLGQDPRRTDRVFDVMDATLVGHLDAKAALDVACWDLFGKSVGLPVCELLGGSTNTPMPMISSIHVGDPEQMRARVADHRTRGYLAHSIKIGALDGEGGPALDAERIAACLADRRPGEFFVVDANGGLLPETALRMIQLLPPGLDFALEAPCATLRETKSLRERCPYPLVIDELVQLDADIALVVAQDLADGIGLKISKAGGLTPGRRHRDIARAAGLTMSVQDTTGSSIAFAAIVHLGATVPGHLLRGVLNCQEMVSLRTAEFTPVRTAGGILPPAAPGLGITVHEDVLGAPIMTWSA